LLINESEAVGFDKGVRGSGRHGREARRGERAGTSESIASHACSHGKACPPGRVSRHSTINSVAVTMPV